MFDMRFFVYNHKKHKKYTLNKTLVEYQYKITMKKYLCETTPITRENIWLDFQMNTYLKNTTDFQPKGKRL